MINPSTRILVTGAGGQLGRELLRSLGSFHPLLATVHRASSAPELAQARTLDLANLPALHAVLDEFCPSLILNAAAYTAVDAAETNEAQADLINRQAPAVLAAWARRHDAALVHYSTDYVFDGSGEQPWHEDAPTGPLNVYGRSKLAGEQAIRESGAMHLILRTSWVYGVWGQNFVKKMFELALSRPELNVIDDQIGSPTSARWLAELTRYLIEPALAEPAGDLAERFVRLRHLAHAVCGGETSWAGFASEIFRQTAALGLPVPTPRILPVPATAYPLPASRPHNSRLACDRLRGLPGLVVPTWQAELARNLPQMHAQFLIDREQPVRGGA